MKELGEWIKLVDSFKNQFGVDFLNDRIKYVKKESIIS